jgi:hypothetical protein
VREGRLIERVLCRVHVQEPAEQQVGVDPLDQLRLAADGVEALQEQRFEQPLGRHRRPAVVARVRRVEEGGHLRQLLIDHPLDRPQRVIRADA